ncbi:macrophage mannose receptor 1-like [Poecilia latipinna]|uniref:macrophage mannose receptor 1-like n=1 Tax=Poecilia latipinna TaxID=48699 RepID=UPI00072E4DC9|nr:PREDICTED: macrophage mannose receptor 1-like [Poecilia latipinna]
MQWSLILLFLMAQCCFMDCQLYQFHYINENKTWTEAQQYCREKHTDLVTVTNMKDMKRLINISAGDQKEAWIGLNDPINGIRTWRWSLPGVEFNESETNWNPGEPWDRWISNCGILGWNARWFNAYCTYQSFFLCYDDKMILIKENKTWEEALYYCRGHHHDLVTITNMDKEKQVQEKVKNASTPFVWIGLRFNCSRNVWFWVCDNWTWNEQKDDCNMFGAMEAGGEHRWFQRNGSERFNFICTN